MFNTGLRFNSLHPLKPLSLRTHLHPLSLHPFAGTVFWNTAHPLRSIRTSCDSAADFCSDFGHITFLLSLTLQKHNIAGGPKGGPERWVRRRALRCLLPCVKCIGEFLQGSFHDNAFYVKCCAKLGFTYDEGWLTSNCLITI